jgi:hypothetical protein
MRLPQQRPIHWILWTLGVFLLIFVLTARLRAGKVVAANQHPNSESSSWCRRRTIVQSSAKYEYQIQRRELAYQLGALR